MNMHAYLPKIHLGTLALALLVFLLPWTNITCADHTIATQSGLQSITGGISLSAELKEMQGASGDSESKSKSDLGMAALTLLALLAVLAGVAVAAIASFGKMKLSLDPGIFAGAALVLLLLQAVIGFPVDTSIAKEAKPVPAEARGGGDLRGAAPQSHRAGGFYVELLLLVASAGLAAMKFIPKTRPMVLPPGSPPMPPGQTPLS